MGAIAALGLAGTGLAYLLYYSLLAQISATHVSAVTYLLPIWGLLWGYLAREQIGWTAYIGVAVVILGLVLLNLKPTAAKRSEPLGTRNRVALASELPSYRD